MHWRICATSVLLTYLLISILTSLLHTDRKIGLPSSWRSVGDDDDDDFVVVVNHRRRRQSSSASSASTSSSSS